MVKLKRRRIIREEEAGNFRVDLRLLLELGERLISRDEVALVELVKNAYDADALSAKIIMDEDRIEIKDNGEGMGPKEIHEGWLTVGSVLKKRNTRTKKKRRVLGEKGLGGLAVLRLGKSITIYTKKEGEACYRITMDWEGAREGMGKNVYTPIENMSVKVIPSRRTGIFPKGHGTTIIIEKLNSEWDKKRIEQLKGFLSRLVEPQKDQKGRKDRFDIRLYSGKKKIKIEPPSVAKNPHYFMEVEVDDDGEFSGTIRWNMEKGHGEEKIEPDTISNSKLRTPSGEIKKWKKVSEGGCGGFSFRLNVWDLDAKELRGHKTVLKQWSGISLLRDGFRVVQPDIDWLGMDLRRVQSPTMRLSTNQVIGSVFFSSDENPHLVDKTDREGIVENESLDIMKAAIHHFMDKLERKKYALRRVKTLSRGVIFSYLDTTPLRYLAKKLPPQEKKEVSNYASQIDKFRDMLEEWILGRDRMATMGMLGARLIHEARGALLKITDNYPLIEKHIDDFDQKLRQRIERMVSGGKMLAKIFMELDPFLKFRGKRRQDIDLKETIKTLQFLFGPELKKNEIELVDKIPVNTFFRANPTDIYVMLANFLDNSLYWLKTIKARKKILEFRAYEKNDSLTIEVADNGPGISPEIMDFIFDASYTTKPDGTGLGLSIVKDIVDFYGGRVEATDDGNLGGALLKVTLPLKEK